MRQVGLTSVTFRNLPPHRIIQIAKKAGLKGMEWGGDIHVPHGQTESAKGVREATQAEGLKVFSYGSYYRLGIHDQPEEAFRPVLQTAHDLGAGTIRIWPGVMGSDSADLDTYQRAAEETKRLCGMADAYGIRLSYEYHPDTLTDCAQSALRLLSLCGDCGIGTYWQPRLIPVQDNMRELRQIKDFVTNIHVFHWKCHKGMVTRMPLAEGQSDWKSYLDIIPEHSVLIMEFVKNDTVQQFYKDVNQLLSWI